MFFFNHLACKYHVKTCICETALLKRRSLLIPETKLHEQDRRVAALSVTKKYVEVRALYHCTSCRSMKRWYNNNCWGIRFQNHNLITRDGVVEGSKNVDGGVPENGALTMSATWRHSQAGESYQSFVIFHSLSMITL